MSGTGVAVFRNFADIIGMTPPLPVIVLEQNATGRSWSP